MESKKALMLFRDRYVEEADPRLRYDWVDGAASAGAGSVAFLVVVLDDKEHQIRERSLDEIGRLGGYKAYKVVAPLLGDGKVSVRVRAVRAYLELLRTDAAQTFDGVSVVNIDPAVGVPPSASANGARASSWSPRWR